MTTETEKNESISTSLENMLVTMDLTNTKEVLENIPTMTLNEIKSLTDKELYSIYQDCEDNMKKWNDNERYSIINYRGKNKKLYRPQREKKLKENRAYITAGTSEGDVLLALWVRVWNTITWVYSETFKRSQKDNCGIAEEIYRWELKYVIDCFKPKDEAKRRKIKQKK